MKKIITIFLLSFIIGIGVHADAVVNGQSFTYLFHLYYDNGQLVADRDYEFKYDIIVEEFVPETLNTNFPYKGEVINFLNKVEATFQFDPRQGNPNFLKGTLSIKAPYFPDGQKVNFYDGQGNQLLSIFVSESSFCNDDGVCNSDVGESTKSCPADCKSATPAPNPTAQESSGKTGMAKAIIYIIIGLVIVGGWYGGSAIWRRWQKRKQSSMADTSAFLPPTPPNQNNQV